MSDTERTVRVAAALLNIDVMVGRNTGLIYLVMVNGFEGGCLRTWEQALEYLTKLKGQEKPK